MPPQVRVAAQLHVPARGAVPADAWGPGGVLLAAHGGGVLAGRRPDARGPQPAGGVCLRGRVRRAVDTDTVNE